MPVKRLLYYLIALALPLLILLLAELVLRVIGYGDDYPLFIPSSKHADYLEPNPAVIQRYFTAEQAPPLSLDTQLILREKAAGSFRIVVQGGSTAAGFPYGRWGSLQALLQQRFKRDYPDRHIEVINAAMSAINSYSLLDFQPDILALKPDLVVVYAGHNEFLGILGAGSAMRVADSAAGTLLYLKLRKLRLFQLLQQLLSQFTATPSADRSAQRSLMAHIAQGADIPINSALYQATLNQFETNISLLLQRYKQQQVPVILGTLVSNEADLVPFSAINLTDWPALLATASAHRSNNLPIVVTQHQAAAAFLKGTQALQRGESSTALALLQQARDADSLRFRAPGAFNSLLRQLAEREQVILADVEQRFRQASPQGIIGKTLLLEHVHPNGKGYLLLADSFYQAIQASGITGFSTHLSHPINATQSTAPSTVQPAIDLPLTTLDVRYASLKIANLLRQYPFRQPDLPPVKFSPVDALDGLLQQRLQGADWLSLQQQLGQFYLQQKDADNAVKALAMLADAMPFDADLAQDTGLFYLQLGHLPLANYYLAAALRQHPTNLRYLLNMAQLRFQQQQFDASLALLRRAKVLAPNDQRTAGFISKVQQVQTAQTATHKN